MIIDIDKGVAMTDIIKKAGNGQIEFVDAINEGIKRLGELSLTNPSAIDITMLRAALGHADIKITTAYLAGLQISR